MKLGNLIRRETWIFDIQEDLQYDQKNIGHVEITFTDGQFVKATFPFENPYRTEEWDLLAQINGKITEIEKYYKDRTWNPSTSHNQ